jgi:hypothetical protein
MLYSALVLALVAGALAGCGTNSADETTSSEAVSSAAVETTASIDTSASAPADASTAPGNAELQAELEAIQRELDAMTLPDDADFSDIEGALQ